MQPTTSDRRAFDEFMENTRCDIFRMYETLREVQRGEDMLMCDRMARLGVVAVGAQQVFTSIAALNAAVWNGGEPLEEEAMAPVPEVFRVLAGVR